MLICPHCQGGVSEDSSLAGQLIACPHCGETFRQPGALAPLAAQPLTVPNEQQRPVNILVTGHPPPPRLSPDGWFARAFSTTSGILAALFLFLIVLPLGFLVVLGIGVSIFTIQDASGTREPQSIVRPDPQGTVRPAEPALLIRARREAGPQLRRMGLGTIQGKPTVEESGDIVILRGQANDESGAARIVTFEWEVTGDNWRLDEYSLDGQSFQKK